MPFNIAPHVAAAVRDRLVTSMMDTLRASTPMLSWHWQTATGETLSEGGSAFLVQTPTRILGITARHVADGFVAAQRKHGVETAILGGLTFNLEDRIIDRGKNVDIATFAVSEAELTTIGFWPLENAWPPVLPARNGIVLLAGWPGHERVVGPRVTGGAYLVWGLAGVSELQVTIRLEHEGAFSPIQGVPIPPPGFDFGGISGGPVMLVDSDDNKLALRFRVAAVIKEGRPDYNYIVATLADVILDDGRITG
jgi:hypothetical protein